MIFSRKTQVILFSFFIFSCVELSANEKSGQDDEEAWRKKINAAIQQIQDTLEITVDSPYVVAGSSPIFSATTKQLETTGLSREIMRSMQWSIVSQEGSGAAFKYYSGKLTTTEDSEGTIIISGTAQLSEEFTSIEKTLQIEIFKDVGQVAETDGAHAARRQNGSVIAWGDALKGGDTSVGSGGDLSSDVISITATGAPFDAIKKDGSVIAWGDAHRGGDVSVGSGGDLTSGVASIAVNNNAFVALKDDGSIIAWGDGRKGGDVSVG